MTTPVEIDFEGIDLDQIATFEGRIAVLADPGGTLDRSARRVNRTMRGALERLVTAAEFAKAKPGDARVLACPVGMTAEAVDVIALPRKCSAEEARRAGVALAKARGGAALLVLAGNHPRAAELALGLALRDYEFSDHKTDTKAEEARRVRIMASRPEMMAERAAPRLALAEGVFFTRDLINEPANVLTTTEFAKRLKDMTEIGLKVEVLDEPALAKLGMGALLSVGEGSDSLSKVVVMEWAGGDKGAAPLALIGKGVVFDTGGISLKPAAGMEDMTMDMGGAGVVAGAMRALARRGAKANVVGIVGLVENMPSGRATRPGDVVRSMKGDTIEVVNTDAEGRLVLADVMWYAQERFKPAAMVDLATLTGACVVALGHENAAVFSNDDALCTRFLKAAQAEGEGAWRMPLGQGYADQLKSRIADVKNTGGRPAGAATAAEFLHRFVREQTPWLHIDIAGVASVKSETPFAPQGATGWGVMALNRLVDDMSSEG
ncbi:leucyl aminopeptidase [Salinihabitans flavidus]|uniref:Probable cytosol aminopeptidase n=1 Tax=Salinihabitans flavidus TaxID=569882 RepID=A0A1H8RQ11_9RHOB|nr:leucyl aminopeptidase [Salinihabitans flavidus]SEO68254.1 leucyl aminopeptidase [Salinihabitans flavidus]